MYLGRVIGTVVSTSKNEQLVGMKFLIVERLTERLERDGSTEIAVDSVGAGNGEIVLVTHGSSARYIFRRPDMDPSKMFQPPIDNAIVGIVDTVEVS